MHSLNLSLEFESSRAMGLLLAAVFNKELKDEPFRDGYEAGSRYLVASVEQELVGLVRLSPWPVSPMQDWLAVTGSPDPFQRGPRSVEITGGVVAPAWRRRGLSRLLVQAALLHCAEAGFAWACAAVEPGSLPHPLLLKLGFAELGEPLVFGKQGFRIQAVPLQVEIEALSRARWQAGFEAQLRRYAAENLRLVWPQDVLGLPQSA